MIKNSLKYIKNYLNLSDKIRCGLEYLMQNNLKLLENGGYDISGDDIYVNIQDYNTKPKENGLWEAHRKYIDIQFMIEGSELIGVGEIQDLNDNERNLFMKDVADVAKAIQKAYNPDRINYGAYGDSLGHLHIHLVPKWKDGYEWGGTFLMNTNEYSSDEELAKVIDDIKKNYKA